MSSKVIRSQRSLDTLDQLLINTQLTSQSTLDGHLGIYLVHTRSTSWSTPDWQSVDSQLSVSQLQWLSMACYSVSTEVLIECQLSVNWEWIEHQSRVLIEHINWHFCRCLKYTWSVSWVWLQEISIPPKEGHCIPDEAGGEGEVEVGSVKAQVSIGNYCRSFILTKGILYLTP